MSILTTEVDVLKTRKFSLPVLFYVVSLAIVTATVTVFFYDFRNRDLLIIDLVKQQNSLTKLQALQTGTREKLTQLIYLNEEWLEPYILSSTEDFEFVVVEFVEIATKYDFITDLSLYSKIQPSFAEMREIIYQVVRRMSIGKKNEAVELLKNGYARYANNVITFTEDALYGKTLLIEKLLTKNESLKRYFIVVFLLEILVTLLITYLIHYKIRAQLYKSNNQLNRLATTDSLTGLYNRRILITQLQHAVAISQRNKQGLGLFYFDLDGFKKINDTLGHSTGDELLLQVAERVKKLARASDIFARMGGDEFIFVVEHVEEAESLTKIANKILEVFAVDFSVGQNLIKMTTSIGISFYAGEAISAEEVIQNGDIAMYNAKKLGGNCYKFYSDKMNQESRLQIEIELEIQKALKNDEFLIYYQPKIDPKTNSIHGAEALIIEVPMKPYTST